MFGWEIGMFDTNLLVLFGIWAYMLFLNSNFIDNKLVNNVSDWLIKDKLFLSSYKI